MSGIFNSVKYINNLEEFQLKLRQIHHSTMKETAKPPNCEEVNTIRSFIRIFLSIDILHNKA